MKLAADAMHPDRRRAGVDAVREQDHDAIAVDPDRGARESHVAECLRRKTWPRELPSQAAILGMCARGFAHELSGDELSADEALGDAEDVARGGEEAGVAARTAGVE